MSWIHESLRIPSDVHGELRCTRWFGRWSVESGGTGQANAYLNALWRTTLRRVIPDPQSIARILILGFGTGGAFYEFYRRFPRAHIVTVEIDPVMIELARRFGALRGSPWPEIHLGSAEQVLPTLHGRFDLIISDMFVGHDVAADTSSPALMRELNRLAHPNGHLIVNAYREPIFFDGFSSAFATVQTWKYAANWIGHFRPHGAGVVGDVLPPGFVPFFACKEYLAREYRSRPKFEVVCAGAAWGVRHTLGPFVIERYHSDSEPIMAPGPLRFVMWDSWKSSETPRGWRRCHGHARRKLTGFSEIPPSGDVHHSWSEHARRARHAWMTQRAWRITDIDAETYCRAYAHCGKPSSLIRAFSEAVRHKMRVHGDLLHLYGVVSRDTGAVIAGIAALDVPEIHASIHVTGFILPSTRRIPSGVGLIHHWFCESQSRGIRFCDFDGFFVKGEPAAWKGFSTFKSQFGTRFVAYPDPYWRIAR